MRTKSTAPVLLAVLGVAAAISPVRGAIADRVPGPASALRPAIVTPRAGSAPALPARLPAVSESTLARARSAVTRSTVLDALTGHVGLSVVDAGPWTTERDQRVLGTVVLVRLSHSSRVAGLWPTLRYDPAETTATPYTSSVTRRSVSDVGALLVQVRAGDNAIVGVVPAPSAEKTG